MTVGEDFPDKQAEVRACMERGIALGPNGRFYVAVCKEILARADEASISGNIVMILRSYKEMKEFLSNA